MKSVLRNPLALLLVSFFVAFCTFAYCSTLLKVLITSTLAGTSLILFIMSLKLNKKYICRCLAVVLTVITVSGAYSIITFDIHASGFEKLSGKTENVKLRITECDYSLSYVAQYVAVIEESDSISSGTKILLTTDKIGLRSGYVLDGEIEYSALSEMNTSSFNAERYYLPKKIMLSAEDISLAVTGESHVFSISGFFKDINDSLSAKITAHSSYDAGGLQAAVLLGNSDTLSDSVSRDFRRLGITHLLVVSGTHFAVIITFIERALRKFKLKRRARALVNIAVILFFMALTGFTPSVMRAGIMYIIAQIAVFISRKASGTNSLAFAAALMVIINPYVAIDCGMQLSVIATYTCITFNKYRSYLRLKMNRLARAKIKSKKLMRFAGSIAETVILTTFITLTTLPLMWLYFGEISLMAIPANIIFIPAIAVLMYLTGIYLLLYPLRIFIIPLSFITDVYCDLIINAAEILARPDFALISINYSFSILFIVPITALIIGMQYASRKYAKRMAAAVISAVVIFAIVLGVANALDYNNVRISYISEKKNEGLVIKSNGKILICDISDASLGFSYNLTEEMSNLHVCEIDVLMLTHYHSKHVQLVSRLCEKEIVRELILTEPIDEREYSLYDSLYQTGLMLGLKITTVYRGESYTFGDATITPFDRTYISRSTHPITAIMISAHGTETVYASSSFNESTSEIPEIMESSEYIILGRHSPVYKKKYSLRFKVDPTGAVVCMDAYEYADNDTREYFDKIGVNYDTEIYRIVIKGSGS